MGQVMYVCGKIDNAPSVFADAPTAYTLISTHTESQTIVAPEDGYFRVEVHGASGHGGLGAVFSNRASGGGGGGGGGCAVSNLKLKKGDTVEITCGAVGSDSSAVIYSSLEDYEAMVVTSGKTAPNCETYVNMGGTGGDGGEARGGNVTNRDGSRGNSGTHKRDTHIAHGTGGTGGASGCAGGNVGGNGESVWNESTVGEEDSGTSSPRTYGKPGLVYFYRGNTNVVAQEV